MLMTESLEIGDMFRDAIPSRQDWRENPFA